MKHASTLTVLLASLFICTALTLPAQTLLRNGDHEDFTPQPSVPDPNDLCFRELYPFGYTPPPLNPVNPPGIASANGSADHRCDQPYSGDAHGGFFISPKMENPFYALCIPVIKGESYELSLAYQLAEGSGQAGHSFFVWLTDTTYSTTGPSVSPDASNLLVIQDPDPSKPLDQMTYQQVHLPFQADATANGLIIGNMTTIASPKGTEVIDLQNGGGGYAYYYVDDLQIRPIPRILPAEAVCPNVPVVLHLTNHMDCQGAFGMDWYAIEADTVFLGTGDSITWQGPVTTRILAANARDTIETTVEINSMLVATDTFYAIPNVFTPNQDGTNDDFKPLLRVPVSDYQMTIHSRWGKEVFQTRDPMKGWDGRYQDENLPSESYVYRIEMTFDACGIPTTRLERGEVTLIR